MQQWEYIAVDIEGAEKTAGITNNLGQSKNMRVSCSDGRYADKTMPVDPMGILNDLGSDGWEMVSFDGNFNRSVHAVFKRPKQ